MFLKIYYENKIHKISKIPETYIQFLEKIMEILHNAFTTPNTTIQYEDDEGDRIMLSSEDDYKTMISTELGEAGKTVKIFISQRRLSANSLPMKRKGILKRSSDKALSDYYQSSDEDKNRLSDHKEEKTAISPRQKAEAKCKAAAAKKSTCKQGYFGGVIVKDTKSVGGEIFELPKNSVMPVTKFYTSKGLVELASRGHVRLFPIEDIQIIQKDKFFPKVMKMPKFAEPTYKKVQFSY